MNLEWINALKLEKIKKQKELMEYYNQRSYIAIDMIKMAKLVKENAILNAKKIMLENLTR